MPAQLTNLDELLGRLDEMAGKIDEATLRAANDYALRCQNEIKAICPVDTGRLRAGVEADSESDGEGRAIAKIWDDVEYGVYVEFRWGGRYSFFWPGIDAAGDPLEIWREYLDEALGA